MKNISEKIAATEAGKLTAILASIGEGVISTDLNGQITLFNQHAELISGYSRDEMVGENFDKFMQIISVQSDEKRKNLVQRALWAENLVSIFEDVTIQAKDRSAKNIYLTGTPIIGQDQKKIGAVFVFRDITEQKRTAEELRKAEQYETLGFFAGGLAHDFNNVLTTINNNVGRVLLNNGIKKGDTEILEGIGEAVSHAKKLTAQLLTFAKGGSPVLEVISIADLIRSTAKFILPESTIDLQYDVADGLWNIKGDESQIIQVIQNLVINAAQAMEKSGGTIHLLCNNVLVSEPADSSIKSGRFVEISIQDAGVGIPETIEKNIFTPYFTTKENGSGLGLAVSYSIAKKHHGTLTFTSKEGEGSTFVFRIPACTEGVDTSKSHVTLPSRGRGRILIMDDDKPLLASIAGTLQGLGYDVQTSQDGEEAIVHYVTSKKAEKPFDLVLLDLTVPGKMGGAETLRLLQEFDHSVKAVVSSGYSNDYVLANYKKYGFCDILKKPYQTHTLSRVVRDAIASSPSAPWSADGQPAEIHTAEESSNLPGNMPDQQVNSLVDHTYPPCRNELSSGELHNIRNAMTPLILEVEKLKENLDAIDLSSYSEIVNELSAPNLSEERKSKLIRLLTLSNKLLNQQLKRVNGTTNVFTKKILSISKIIEHKDS